MTVHLIYPHKKSIAAPNVIGFKLKNFLSEYYDVKVYDWEDYREIRPKLGDILIGHSHPLPFTVLRRSAKLNGWTRKILIHPFNSEWKHIGYIDDLIDDFDSFLTITGDYWFSNIDKSEFARWLPKMVHLNLAVDLFDYPRVKSEFNSPGSRKFLYIGNDHPGKNVDFLNAIAINLPDVKFAWAGKGRKRQGLDSLGYIDFSTQESRELLCEYDFMITVGSADANPTTILESIGFGLIPVATVTSGYFNMPGLINISGIDLASAVNTIHELQCMQDIELRKISIEGLSNVKNNFNWDIFFAAVKVEIERRDSNCLALYYKNFLYRKKHNESKPILLLKFIYKNIQYFISRHF